MRKIILSSPDATPSRALRKPENVTEDWYLAQSEKKRKTPHESSTVQPQKSGHIPVLAGLDPFVERRIDVFHQDYAPFWSVREEMEELVVC